MDNTTVLEAESTADTGSTKPGHLATASVASDDTTWAQHFGWWLAVIAAVGLALRLFVVMQTNGNWVAGDGFAYSVGANDFANGHPFVNIYHPALPTAIHPPAWPLVLGIVALLGGHTWLEQQLVACFVGTLTVVAIGFAGRRIAGAQVGLIAAGIGAVYAGLWVYERDLLSETLLLLGIAITLLVAYRYRDAPSAWLAAGLGIMTGLLALTRSEQILIWAFVVVPLILTTRSVALRRRVGWLALATACLVLVLAPWTIYNTTRFQHLVPLSTGFGGASATANCDIAYYGPYTGFYNVGCLPRVQNSDESVADSANRRAAITYAEHHLGRLPVVLIAREGRAFGFWNPFQQIGFDSNWQDTPSWVNRMELFTYWLLLVPAVIGVVEMRRRRRPLFPMLAFVGTVIVTVAATYGETRYRAAAEVPLVLLAAVGIGAGLRHMRARRSHENHADTDTDADTAPESTKTTPPEAGAAPGGADGAPPVGTRVTASKRLVGTGVFVVAVVAISALFVAGVSSFVGAAVIQPSNYGATIATPSDGAPVSGSQRLVATTTTDLFVTSVVFEVRDSQGKTSRVAHGYSSPLDWVAYWNTRTAPNGTYRLWCVVSFPAGKRVTSDPIRVVVDNR